MIKDDNEYRLIKECLEVMAYYHLSPDEWEHYGKDGKRLKRPRLKPKPERVVPSNPYLIKDVAEFHIMKFVKRELENYNPIQ